MGVVRDKFFKSNYVLWEKTRKMPEKCFLVWVMVLKFWLKLPYNLKVTELSISNKLFENKKYLKYLLSKSKVS